MARALNKVQKKITKKRGGKKPTALHENSRDAQRLRTAGAREQKIQRAWDEATANNQFYVDRVLWFQDAIVGSTGPLTDEELRTLTDSYIAREDEKIAQAKAERRPGRPPTKTEERLTQVKDIDEREYKSGFWVPELRNAESRGKLERWAGEWSGLNILDFVRVVRSGAIKPSSFPPKSLS